MKRKQSWILIAMSAIGALGFIGDVVYRLLDYKWNESFSNDFEERLEALESRQNQNDTTIDAEDYREL